MAVAVHCKGSRRWKPGHAYATQFANPRKERQATDQLTGKPAVDEYGRPVMETIVGWEPGDTVIFTRILAETYGRASQTNEKDDGEEWAQLFVEAENLPYGPEDAPFELQDLEGKTIPAAVTRTGRSRGGKATAEDQTPESVSVTGGVPTSLADAPPAVTEKNDAS